MKYTIYLFTLTLALMACSGKKKAMEGKDTSTAQKAEEEKVLSSEERQAAIAKQMKKEKMPNQTEGYLKYAEQEMPVDAVARIQRTNCFGRCPVYTLTVFSDGRLEYFGKKFTTNLGKYTGKVDVQKVEMLMKRAEEISYTTLNNVYDNEHVTDLPSTITSIRKDGELKTIVNRFDAPEELRQFEKFFDSLFEAVDWEAATNE